MRCLRLEKGEVVGRLFRIRHDVEFDYQTIRHYTVSSLFRDQDERRLQQAEVFRCFLLAWRGGEGFFRCSFSFSESISDTRISFLHQSHHK